VIEPFDDLTLGPIPHVLDYGLISVFAGAHKWVSSEGFPRVCVPAAAFSRVVTVGPKHLRPIGCHSVR
jgi:hypothetical protein